MQVSKEGQEFHLKIHLFNMEGDTWDTPSWDDIKELISTNFTPHYFISDLYSGIETLRQNIILDLQGSLGMEADSDGLSPVYSRVTFQHGPPRWFSNCRVNTFLTSSLLHVKDRLKYTRAHGEDGWEPNTYHFYVTFSSHPLRFDFVTVEIIIYPPVNQTPDSEETFDLFDSFDE